MCCAATHDVNRLARCDLSCHKFQHKGVPLCKCYDLVKAKFFFLRHCVFKIKYDQPV